MSNNKQTVEVNDVVNCIKVLNKIKTNPKILNEPLFKPIYEHLQKLNHISNLTPSELTEYVRKRRGKLDKENDKLLRANDKKLKKQSRIRIERKQRAQQSEQFRQYLQNKIIIKPTENKTSEPSKNEQESKQERILYIHNICYVCKRKYNQLHFFYDALCPKCGDIMNCEGKIALITGCRTKVGYEIAIKLLNAKCTILGTTRFPKYAAIKFSKEKNFHIWKHRLFIFELDFCKMHSVDKFIKHILNKYKHIDILINNAATTVRRTQEFYMDIIEIEQNKMLSDAQNKLMIDYEKVSDNNGNKYGNLLALQCDVKTNDKLYLKHGEQNNILHKVLKDIGGYDEFSQRVDLRNDNSWTQLVETVQPMEALQAIMVNQFVPFLLIKAFIPILANDVKDKNTRSFIINATAIEGHFNSFKQGTHPHTNMAKAALNGFTRMYSKELVKYNVFMCSVDIGWFADDLPLTRRIKSKLFQWERQKLDNDEYDMDDFVFHAPLDIVDAGARVLHPIWSGLRNDPYYGVFLKDYRLYGW